MKESDSMKMIRDVRDKNYETTKDMDHDGYIEYINKKALIGKKIMQELANGKQASEARR